MVGYIPNGAAAGATGAKLGGNLRAMALAHREGDPRAAMSRGSVRRLSLLLVVVNLGLGSLALIAGAAVTDLPVRGRVMLAAIGAFWIVTSLLLLRGWSLRPAERRLVSTSTVDGRPATVIRMSRHRMAEALWLSGGIVILCVAGSVLALTSDMGGFLLFTGLLTLILLPVALDMALALTRPVGIILTSEGIDVRSWYFRATLPWDELWLLTMVAGTHGTRLVARGKRLPARRPRKLFSFWPWQERPGPNEAVIDVDAIEPHGRPLEALLYAILSDRQGDVASRMGTPWAQEALQPRPGRR